MPSPLGLYLHIPFCESICNYCNFNRGLLDDDLKRRYARALEHEIRRAGDGAPVDTIYFGGGTPSLLESREVEGLLQACRDAFDVDRDVEVTLEVNPETATPSRLGGWLGAGVNRLSFGVQSFSDLELQRLGRRHGAARAARAIREARAAGFDDVSVDLMLWLPGQSLDESQASVHAMVELGPDHASLYLLELYPNAPLKEDMARAGWSLAPDDAAAEMYLSALETTDAAGYEQYEISNIARTSRQCRHNLKYWSDGEWLGFGCGAHSTRSGVRWRNVAETSRYVDLIDANRPVGGERRVLSHSERVGDRLFTGLRLAAGLDLDAVARDHDFSVMDVYGAELEAFFDRQFLALEGSRLRLTRQGMLMANEVMAVFV